MRNVNCYQKLNFYKLYKKIKSKRFDQTKLINLAQDFR